MKNLGYIIEFILILISFCTIFFATSAYADSMLSARYVKPRGTHIKWKIRIPSPPPAAVIVTQHILPGSEVFETSHPLNSYDKEKGIAKWLVIPAFPGMLKMQMKLSKPIRKKGEIRGEIQFMDSSQNITSTVYMKPRMNKRAMEGC